MRQLPRIRMRVTFLRASDGGRSTRLVLSARDSGVAYMPHLLVGDPGPASTTSDGRRKIEIADRSEELLGIGIQGEEREVVPGEPEELEALLLYHPAVSYAALQPGVPFVVLEGPFLVGHGEVLGRDDPPGA